MKNNKEITIRKIKNRFKIIENQILILVENRYYFDEYIKFIGNNNAVDKKQDFLRFISDNYKLLAVIEVCNQAVERDDVESLINLLEDIKDYNELFTIDWYKNKKIWKPVYGSDQFGRIHKISRKKEAKRYFEEFTNSANDRFISKEKIEQDIKKIKKAIGSWKKTEKNSLMMFRHKRSAHFANDSPKINIPVEDLFSAINLLEEMTLKYGRLMDGYSRLLPAGIELEFEKIFKI